MSSVPTPSLAKRLSLLFVFWFPLVMIAVLVAGAAVVWFTTTAEDRAISVLATWAVVILGVPLLLFWLLFAPIPRAVRFVGLACLLLPILAVVISYRVEDLRLTGDMRPVLRPRFGPDHDTLLQEQLAGAVNRPVPEGVDLSGKRPTDWAEYRGPRRDGVVLGPELLRDWTASKPRLVWRKLIGGGHSAFVVVDKVLFTMEQRQDNEVVTCYDAATGEQIWAFAYPTLFDDRAGDKGPRATPAVADGEVFAFGATGKLTCLDARTGKAKWGPIDTLEGNANVQWGMSGSPLILNDLVIVNVGVQKPGAPHGTLVAFERASGSVRWSTGTANAGYSSPQLSTVAGKPQLLLFDGEGLAGYDPADKGKQLWRFGWPPNPPVNVGQPLVVDDNRIFISSNYGMGCILLEVTEANGQWSTRQVWKNTRMSCKFTSPVYYEGHFYGLDNGRSLVCLDAKNGARKWVGGDYGNGQMLLCKDLLVIQSESGPVALVQATFEGHRELGTVEALDGRSWNVPAMADGKLYVRNNREMACLDLAAR